MTTLQQREAPGKAKTAAIYVRVSSAGQEDNYSLQTQEDACRRYAGEHGYGVAGVYREVYSGVELWDRPQLTILRDAVRRRDVDVVIAYGIDRLSRDPVHLGVILTEAEHAGADVEFVTEPLDNSPEGQLIRFVRGYAAKIEHEKIRERSIRGRRARAQSGKPIPTSRPPYGYQWTDDRERLETDPVTAPVVQRVFRRCLEGAPLRQIADELTRAGIPTATGKGPWRRTAVHYLLRHAAYAGRASAWRGEIPLPDGTIPALVDAESFAEVQGRLRLNQQRASRNARDPEAALLRGGYVHCGVCGDTMVACTVNGGLSYACRSEFKDCPRPSMRVHLVDALVWERVERILSQPETIAEELAKLQGDDPTAEDIAAVDRNIAKMEREETNLVESMRLVKHASALNTLAAKLDQIAAARDQLLNERNGLARRRDAWAAAGDRMRELVAWCELVASRLKTFSWQEKRLALDALSVQVQVFPSTTGNGRGDPARCVVTATVMPLDSVPSAASNCVQSDWSLWTQKRTGIVLRWTDKEMVAAV